VHEKRKQVVAASFQDNKVFVKKNKKILQFVFGKILSVLFLLASSVPTPLLPHLIPILKNSLKKISCKKSDKISMKWGKMRIL